MKTLLALSLLVAPAAFAAAPATTPSAADLRAYAGQAEHELKTNILPWWLKNAPDPEHGGFHSFIGEDMVVRDQFPRGALLTSRILWTFSAAYRRFHDPAYLAMADRAYRDLVDRFIDREHGGLYWSVDLKGKPRDTTKQIYGQVFGIYALAEYFRATGKHEALDQAIAIFHVVDKYAHDPVNGGYYDTMQGDWTRPTSMKNVLGDAPKSQNSHIHILEGFASLMRVWPDDVLRARQKELLGLILTRIIDPRTHHLVLFMRDDWTPIGDEISYGHDIELAWLVVEASDILGDPGISARARQAAVEIARVTNAEGVDTDGGIYNEGNPKGPTNTHKEWWEQAEATVGFLNAYQISGDPRFYAYSVRSWKFIEDRFVDRVHGDWHNTLERDDTPILEITAPNGRKYPDAKLSVWKCPYHNSRACMELMERLDELAAKAR
ncbi:MAG TPA: AGE family epimerase/isomerase [Candidatus Didemnitutus sp.]|jgi:mannobiose 2-epimerase